MHYSTNHGLEPDFPPFVRHLSDMADDQAAQVIRIWFIQQLRTALNALYDPTVLGHSPLLQLLESDQRRDRVFALRDVLTKAIEALHPRTDAPADSRIWRVYQVLRSRYIEQLPQPKVAADLSLSLRQLQREESAAREVLADYLWAAHGLTAKAQDMARMAASVGSPAEPGKAAPTLSQELEWLERSAPVVSADVGEVIGKVLETVRPLLETGGVLVEYVPPEPPLRLNLQTAVLRQALINAASIAVRHAPSGCLCISAQADPEQLIVDVRSLAERRLTGVRLDETNEGLRITGELLRLSRGALQILPVNAPEVFAARIMLPIGRLVTVLVVDDNADTLQLFHRYLSGSRYQFVGAQNARQALALAEETFPQVRVSQNFRSPNRAVIMAGSSTTP